MTTTAKKLISLTAPATILAAEQVADGAKKGPRKFEAEFYTGGLLDLEGWDHPVVVDLAGMEKSKILVADLDHDRTKRVGNFELVNDGKTLKAIGVASAATAARDEVVNSADDGYQWQASLEARPKKMEFVRAGASVEVNGQKFTGPIYVARASTLKGFGFVSHGADDDTSVSIAASRTDKEHAMDAGFKSWAENMLVGVDVESLPAEALANLQADYAGQNGTRKKIVGTDAMNDKVAEASRRQQIFARAEAASDQALDSGRHASVLAIREARDAAIKSGLSARDFEYELRIADMDNAPPRVSPADRGLSNKILEAAVCMAGMLDGHEKMFDDATLQAAHDRFRHGIGLKELVMICAQANGYQGSGFNIDIEVQRAAFGMLPQYSRNIQAASNLSLPYTLANTANKFIREQFMFVDQAWREIASVRSVRDFKQIQTTSLTGSMMFDQIGADGEIHHGQVGEQRYVNQADTYAKMFAINRKDLINDDMGALTQVPRRLGRGAALKLNDIFWAEFLNNGSFFTAGNNNVNTGVADMTLGGLSATELIFQSQVDYDSMPLGSAPRTLLVPTALNAAALTLMASERIIDGTSTAAQGDANIWRGRFKVVSTPYLSNSNYTGYSAAAWYMLGDPNDLPVIELVALNGRIEPVVETADADFHTLGIQMRGYSDIGANLQEPKGGVRADGGSS